MKDFAGVASLQASDETMARCPLTGAPMHPLLTVPRDWRRPTEKTDWTIWWSDRADFGQIFPRPTPSEAAGYYDIEAYYTHAERLAPDAEAEAREVGLLGRALGALAFRFERGAEPTRAWWRSVIPPNARHGLEIGCGDGDRMLTFGPFLQTMRGVEPDPRAVSVACGRGLTVLNGTAEDLPAELGDRQHDVIVFSHVLEHTIDPVKSLTNAAALLAPGGLMSVEVPNNGSTGMRQMRANWRWLDAPRHLNFFTEKSLVACAEAAGLTVRAVLYRGYVRQFMPDWIVDEARIGAVMEGRALTRRDIRRQLAHSVRLLARTALAHPSHKYDSVRILCTRA